ncbi:Ubiquitin domain-containing protein DSK2b [Zostera marina]|uniref:Ubiquilin n=1 Tax=Zostera marina TaxID=29655 RepID=A0A0K9Q3T2_ZOSMR|nr:Ubiquitin domain-containing protein DSK2b [Zostera marina]
MNSEDCVNAPDAGASSEVTVMINVRSSNGSKFPVQTKLDVTVALLKEVVAGNSGVPKELQRLIYKGKILKDDQTLKSYGMAADHTIHMVRSASPSASSNPPASTTVNTKASTNPNNSQSSLGTAGFDGMQLPGLGFLGGHQDINQIREGLAQNPDMLRKILNMPAMRDFLNNPDFMQNVVMNNPQTRQLIDRHPELAHVLNDPSFLSQAMDVARNPELMREMTRNTDRAISNIESSPEGFNALRRMYENLQEPFTNPTNVEGHSGTDIGSNPFSAFLETVPTLDSLANPSTTGTQGLSPPNSNPLPNPWSDATRTGQANQDLTGGNARASGITGLSEFGLPNMQQMSSFLQDSSAFERMLENPDVMQMMQSFMSNPQYMEQQVIALQQSLSSMGLNHQQDLEHNQTDIAGTGPTVTPNIRLLLNMLGGGAQSGASVPNTHNVPPEQLYATQLSQLQEMGFFDTQENIRALSSTSGNVNAAIERLLEGSVDR